MWRDVSCSIGSSPSGSCNVLHAEASRGVLQVARAPRTARSVRARAKDFCQSVLYSEGMNDDRRSMRAPPEEPPKSAPAADQVFAMLQDMTATILDAATVLTATLEGRRPPSTAWQAIRDLEHKGDAIARDLPIT